MGQEIVEVERRCPKLALHPRGFLFVHGQRRFFDEANDVAHAQDPARETIGHEELELIELFPHPGELDWSLRDFAHRERRATARIAVEFRQDNAGNAERFMEMRRDADGLLAGGRIRHEEDLLRFQEFLQLFDFFDERRVDLLPARGIEDLDVTVLLRRPIESGGRRAPHIFLLW